MEIVIAVQVPVGAALAGAKTEYGPMMVTPTEEQLRALGEQERKAIKPFVVRQDSGDDQRYLRLRAAVADWDGVIEAIQRIVKTREQSRQDAEQEMLGKRKREEMVPEVAAYLRGVTPYARRLSDREVVDNVLPSLIEDVVEKAVTLGVAADRIRIVHTGTDEWKRVLVTPRASFSLEAGTLKAYLEQAVQAVIPAGRHDLLRAEILVARVRERGKDGIDRLATTHVLGYLHCAAAPSIALLVRAE